MRRRRLIFITVLWLLAVLPTTGITFLTISTAHQDAQTTLDTRLAEVAQTASVRITTDLDHFRQILHISAENPSMTEIVSDPAQHQLSKSEVDRSLLALTTSFPGMIDEACMIDVFGNERGRVVQGAIAPDMQLSHDETRNPFFGPTLALPSGGIHYHPPYLSPDTGRWVLSASTPLYAGMHKYGLL